MKSEWFIIGLLLVFIGFCGYMLADDHESNARMNFLSQSYFQDIRDAQHGKTIAMAFGVFGVLVSLAGIAAPATPDTIPDRNSPRYHISAGITKRQVAFSLGIGLFLLGFVFGNMLVVFVGLIGIIVTPFVKQRQSKTEQKEDGDWIIQPKRDEP
jgi:hypothetical protein